jgi:C-terminal processing protease CtpA/Prc
MKYRLLTLLLFSTLFCFSQTKKSQKSGFLTDLKIYKEIIETSHTGMYLYTTKLEFDSVFKAVKKQIETGEIKLITDFYLALAKIHTKINCGHSSVYPSESLFVSVKKNQKAFFPLQVMFIKDTLVVSADYNEIKKGTQIVKINNKFVKQITADAFKIISSDGYNTTNKYYQLAEDFTSQYFILYGIQGKFELEVIQYPSKKISKITIDGLIPNYTTQTIEERPITDLSYINKKTALLTVNSFATETNKNQKIFFKFLKNSFKEIREKEIENLIVDIRENTGGDDGNDMELASYLINKHFKENTYRKLNTIDLPLYPEYLHPEWKKMLGLPSKITPQQIKAKASKRIAKEFYKGDDGAYYYKEKYIIKKDPQKYLFSGNTYILISGKVFSGGSLFSALVRDKSNAIFVGEETGGGYYRHTGSIPLIYALPNSGLVFSIFIVINEQDVEQNLFPNGRGIIPHFEVYPTIKDFVEENDAVLEYVKENLIYE